MPDLADRNIEPATNQTPKNKAKGTEISFSRFQNTKICVICRIQVSHRMSIRFTPRYSGEEGFAQNVNFDAGEVSRRFAHRSSTIAHAVITFFKFTSLFRRSGPPSRTDLRLVI